ncbi:hypothetical protein COCMIDRAFT_31749 [Bipolaris oryzae ATCC 44560]|uniref:Uncharacterized protein n=1 Tax=Bipolaris oryzae ATCC 44560 TaxID=930090 RepID=W6ZM91_COCMI|nr:uncharacterized protein COCMIDRAFT_31749 [Bipolaris oryzae ATCC 44560]EUC51190.1 hypothetical protein COCMIDRAFT_31749 [Bipolaris oryzae ATCC 44560]
MAPHARYRPPSGAHHGQQARQAVEGAVRLGEPMPGCGWLERLWGWPSFVMAVWLLRHLTGQPAALLYRQERALIGTGTGSSAEPLPLVPCHLSPHRPAASSRTARLRAKSQPSYARFTAVTSTSNVSNTLPSLPASRHEDGHGLFHPTRSQWGVARCPGWTAKHGFDMQLGQTTLV